MQHELWALCVTHQSLFSDFFLQMPQKEEPGENTVSLPSKGTIKYENFHSFLEDPELAECFLALPNEESFLNLPNNTAMESPLDIQTYQ